MRPAALGALLVLVLAAAVLLPAASRTGAAPSDWTFLVYMDADNNLEDVAMLDFLEMASVGSTARVNVVVQFDRASGYSTAYGDWTSTKRFLVAQGMTPDPANALSDLGERDMAAPATLVEFVTWGAATYPADHYFLDLWDHGLGWKGAILDGAEYMSTIELGAALAQVRAALGRPLDVVGGDACRMTLEVMYELQPYADWFVGSQKDVPLEGWPYDRVLGPLAANPAMTPLQVGTILAEEYVSSYRDSDPPGAYSVTLSVTSSAALPAVGRAFADVTAELNASVPLLQNEVIAARLATERYERGGVARGDEFDLFHFAENAALELPNPRLARLAAALETAIRGAVLVNEVWDNPAAQNSVRARHANGFSIWFPDTPTEADYPLLALSRDTGWDGFLVAYRQGTPTPRDTAADARSVDTTGEGLADRIVFDATPPANGTLFLDVSQGGALVASHEVPAVADQAESWALAPPRPGRYNATVLYYVAGDLADVAVFPGLAIQALHRFQGVVRDAAGQPLTGAVVTLRNPTGVELSATTTASGYTLDVVVPDFFQDGDVLTVEARYGGRLASATFVASAPGGTQTVNLVLDASPAPEGGGLLAAAVAGSVIAALLGVVALWQRRVIADLRRRTGGP